MKNPLAALTRLLRGGTQSPVAAQLYAAAIGQPLLVHPAMGEQLIAAYMKGAVDFRPPTLIIGEIAPESTDALGVITQARKVAVLNVSGGLANRYEGDMCDPGPLSYEMLRKSFDMAMADPAVEAIVHRIESPGGMASGLFDYTDHVYASRGKKPIYAAIDDYAYSAAFAIACACDEVWITRSGGAGSVGAIAYHYDQSAWNSKVGVKVTAIYSGEHKNDGSPHAALSTEVRDWLQERMDAMRAMFVDRVATYRGLGADAVAATEAQIYQGQAAIDIGFADRLGTYADMMAHIAAGDQGEEDAPDDAAPASAAALQALAKDGADAAKALTQLLAVADAAPTMSAEDRANMDRAKVSDAVMAADLAPALTVALLKSSKPATPETVDARIAEARAISVICAAAKLPDVAADYVARGVDLETARAQLLAVVAESGPELSTSHPKQDVARSKTKAQTIYEQRAAART